MIICAEGANKFDMWQRLNSRCCGKNCGRRYSYFCDMIDICMCHPSCLVSGGPGYRDKD